MGYSWEILGDLTDLTIFLIIKHSDEQWDMDML